LLNDRKKETTGNLVSFDPNEVLLLEGDMDAHMVFSYGCTPMFVHAYGRIPMK